MVRDSLFLFIQCRLVTVSSLTVLLLSVIAALGGAGRVASAQVASTQVASTQVASAKAPAADLVVESNALKLVLREDLRGIAHLIDKRSGRDYAADTKRSFGLFLLYFGKSFDKAKQSMSSNVTSKELTRIDGGVRLRCVLKGTHPALVDCSITVQADEPAIHFAIDVTNRSNQPLVAIDYPLFTCRAQLGDVSSDDRILYPQHEGVLLCDPDENLRVGSTVAKSYPGSLSAQFLYYFDPEGGLYCGAEDTQGVTKTPFVRRDRDGLAMFWRHELPSVKFGRSKLDYSIVFSPGGPTWQDGADIYRAWAEANAPWCEKKILASATPDWLQQTNVFLNYQVDEKGEFFDAEQADAKFQEYRDYLELPIVACAFNWERHGAWIGPDYFPPRGGEDYYVDLAKRLAARGDHMHVFTSGFRWGVRKTVSQPKPVAQPKSAAQGDQAALPVRQGVGPLAARRGAWASPVSLFRGSERREYTDYDGRAAYRGSGAVSATVIGSNGRHVLQQPKWADNYLLCAGCLHSRQLIGDSFAKIFDYGIAGVDLDQNLGAGISHCYSSHHDHPQGAGRWQYRTMYKFLTDVRMQAREKHPDSFIGVEEPCEVYIPVIDIVHGRAFTDTVWPAAGPGAVSVPLYTYLYHEHQLNYAGWIDRGFSPFGDVRWGIGRATIFGMQLGVRVGYGPFQLKDGEPTQELAMLRNGARVMKRCRDYLLLGRMLHDPAITGAPIVDRGLIGGEPATERRPSLPVDWPAVQATAWRSAEGNICYAVANLGDDVRYVQLLAQPNGMTATRVCLTRIGEDEDLIIQKSVALPTRVTLKLQPWEICCVEQRDSTPQPSDTHSTDDAFTR